MTTTHHHISDTRRAAALSVISAILEVIQESPEGVPSGVLYAILCGNMSLDTYNHIIHRFIELGKVYQRNHVLYPVM